MDFKSLLSQLDQLNEAEGKTVHKGTYGTSYGKEDVRDQYGHKIGKQDKGAETKKDAPKKGRGRPKKGADDSGEVKSYDFSAFGVNKGKDVKLPAHDKKKTVKHSLKEYLDQLDTALNEAEQIQIKPASQMPKKPGQTSQPGQQQGQQAQNTQVIAQGDKTLGTVNNPQLAQQIKQSIGKGEMTLMPDQQMKEGSGYDGSEPLDLSKNPSVNDVFKRALYIYDFEGYGNNMDYSEDDAIDQYVAKNFGLDVLDQLTNARTQGYFGRADGKGPGGGGRTSNLGTSSAPGGNFRTTKAGVMNKQDAKTMKSRVADRLGRHPEPNLPEGDIGKHNNATTGFDALVKKLTPKYGVEAAKRIAGAQLKKIREADMPPNDSLASPLSLEEGKKTIKKDDKAEKAGKKVTKDLEYDMKHKGKDDAKAEKAGKKVTKDIEYDEKKKVKEDKKPDANKNGIPDYAEDGKGKNDLKKKKVKEGMDHRLKAARHMGKAHALTKEGYNCRYDDMEESRHYHEGYKEGLDECYGQMPVQGLVVGETGMPAATVPGMASQAMDNDVMEVGRSDYMKQQAKSTPGDTFKAFGQTFRDKEVVESPFAFEAWDKELNALLEGKVDEGMTVSISKGQQGSPDSVSVTAQDGEADQLLQVIKQAGLGLFGGDDAGTSGQSSSMSLQPADGGPEGGEMGIDVVDDHDGMMNLIRKVTGAQPAPATQGFGGDEGSSDYEDEEGHDDEHGHEGACESCGGMMEAGHECGEGQQMVDEVESEDQMEYEVAEEIDPNNSDEANEVNSDAVRDAALATAASTNEEEQVDEDEAQAEAEDDAQKLDEWANEAGKNGTDTSFEQDIDFMTKVISGGLNKQKSTGQSTIPVVSTQLNRLGNPMQESVDLLYDWKKLSGIK
jgi:hypothetical protein